MEITPLKFHPYLKSVIWGGDKICAYKGIPQPEPNIGESWEISAVPGHESIVSEGPLSGRSLPSIISEMGDLILGKRVAEKYNSEFPLLIKFIDANDNLSVQVHPDDALAAVRHNCPGKTEMWYIIDTEPDAKIFSGLSRAISPDEYVRHIAEGTFASVLAVHDSAPGDLFFIPAGRIHAIGAGNLLVEIQESSDITYRIYDYDRRGADGKPRQLHTELAKDAIDYNLYDDYKAPAPSPIESDVELVACDHFVTRRVILDGEKSLALDDSSFTVLICLDGELSLEYPGGVIRLSRGESLLIPAALSGVTLKGQATLILSRS